MHAIVLTAAVAALAAAPALAQDAHAAASPLVASFDFSAPRDATHTIVDLSGAGAAGNALIVVCAENDVRPLTATFKTATDFGDPVAPRSVVLTVAPGGCVAAVAARVDVTPEDGASASGSVAIHRATALF